MPSVRVAVIIANGFEEIETITAVDMLRRAEVDVRLVTIGGKILTGSRKIRIEADMHLSEIDASQFHAVVIPGGQPGVDHLKANPQVLKILKQMNEKKAWIASLCAGPLVLKEAGILKGIFHTSFPGTATFFDTNYYRDERVVVDQNFITSRSPGTALEFSLVLIEKLCSKEKAIELSKVVLAQGY